MLLASLGAAHCSGGVEPQPPPRHEDVEQPPPPVEPDEEEKTYFPAVARDARLLQVDGAQRVLLSIRADGTYAQALPTGDPVRIADVAEGADITADSHTAVLWSAEVDGERTVWLWRPGTPEALVLSQKARGTVRYDAAQSYVAFLERDDAGATSVRLAVTASCTPGDCALRTPLQVQGGTPVLESGGTTVSLVNGLHRWLIDAPSGTVTDLGDLPGPSFLSPGGTRYGWVLEDSQHVRVFDTATGAQLWEQGGNPAPIYLKWTYTGAFMFNEASVLVTAYATEQWGGPSLPGSHFMDRCWDEGCNMVTSLSACSPVVLSGQPAMHCQSDPCITRGCTPPPPQLRNGEGAWVHTVGSGTLAGPFFNQGFADAVSLKGIAGQTVSLEWTRTESLWKLSLETPAPTAPIQFLPDQQRVLFHQPVSQKDGTVENHLWTWDRFERVDLGLLDGTPGPTRLMRDNPPTAYMDVDTANADGTTTPSIVRVEL
ncbi:hypothetical protein [Corallococcus sp. 4LFB]|uniref:hypothetical protein n=1 Tax=Corallococcus sp. 4LFB TaxID=3383249 RepID=UPI0039766DAC